MHVLKNSRDRIAIIYRRDLYTVMGRIAIIDRRSAPDRDRVRKRGSRSGSAKDRVKNGGSGSGKGSGSPINKKRIGDHHYIYDTLILLYLFIRILTIFYYCIITLI